MQTVIKASFTGRSCEAVQGCISEQLVAGACWEDRKIWLLSEKEMGSFVMHSSQRHQQTCVERRAASGSRRAPGGGFSWETLLCGDFHKQRLQSLTARLDQQQLQCEVCCFVTEIYELPLTCAHHRRAPVKTAHKATTIKPRKPN